MQVLEIAVTKSAVSKVAELLAIEGDPDLSLRLAVRPGGCSGFSYDLFFDRDIAPEDLRSQFGSVQIVMDPTSAEMLKGATLEYRDSLQGSGFHVRNPNAQRSCGCGQSFS